MSRATCCYQAKWLIPVDQPPIENGLLSVADGRIVAVGENLSGAAPIDLGDVALAPGLVNAHTHLEFSDIDAPLGEAGMEFPLWIQQVVGRRRAAGELLETQKAAAISAGIRESQEQGIAALGEITTMPYSLEMYAEEPGVVSLLELIGLSPERGAELLEAAKSHLQQGKSRGMAVGLSPHAPYSVHRDVVAVAARMSADTKTPLAMHLAESRDELQLLDSQSGLFREMLEKFGVWRDDAFSPRKRPVDYLRMLAVAHHALLIHGNYFDDAEINFVAARPAKMTVVYCPRTHAYFDHPKHPLAELLRRGASLAIGTDSRASNPDLALWRDVQLAAKSFPEISPEAWLSMVTESPAKALGIETAFGALAVGRGAKLIAFPLATEVNSAQLFEAILEVEPQPVCVS
ncbi:amidohydrolase family protein [Blastopirellula sp. JC732]|uniref:Amidohydrolase family protein n=1 Tax=Blastopirellula sediminis TaxID=2894196 RepID=A0A9X1SIG0_9BACT|nr:amidohydrolase family protein [Blastopirellula sediminis]MCC9609204.1 amidohydrolase family protein [Blastopirellula sediminis]MCC9628019.1 amidohydrolase family protein [Blastopirellula sediminis]